MKSTVGSVAWAILLSLPWIATGQTFQSLTTTDDGAVLYFSSVARLKGSGSTFNSKIFRWDAASGFQTWRELREPGLFVPSPAGCTTSYSEFIAPQVSADGTVFAYRTALRIPPGTYCTGEPYQGVVERDGQEVRVPGQVALSPNGRYLLTSSREATTNGYHVVTDLLSGLSGLVAGAFSGGTPYVTDEGATLTGSSMALIVTDRYGGTRVLKTSRTVTSAAIDRTGKTVIYYTPVTLSQGNYGYGPSTLTSIDVASGQETTLARDLGLFEFAFTRDGQSVLYHDGRDLTESGVDGSNPRRVGTGLRGMAVSGDGRVAYGSSLASNIAREDLPAGTILELAAPVPLLSAVYRYFDNNQTQPTTVAAAGSLTHLGGPYLLKPVDVTLCGRPISQIPGPVTVRIRIPWDLPDGPCELVVSQPGSPFEHGLVVQVQQYDPQFVPLGYAIGPLVHGNFSGPVVEQSPAVAGEAVTAYFTGLGPVDNSGSLLRPGFTCRIADVAAEVLYAGAVPGTEGFYQVNLRVPMTGPRGTGQVAVSCGWDESTRATGSTWVQ